MTIRLLGPPAIESDGRPVRPPRGRKAWGLLGYLVITTRPPSRQRLAELFFSDAEDPLAALRWTLAELRRALGGAAVLSGDPVVTSFGEDAVVDVHLLTTDSPESTESVETGGAAALLELGAELLEGLRLDSCPEFESWLLVERRRLSAMLEARLRQATTALLATGRAADAVVYAARTVALNPLEESSHELLVRSLATAGDRAAALRQLEVGEDVLRREFGVQASPALREASTVVPGSPTGLPLSRGAAAASQLEAGRAAIAAGAVDAGLQCLRQAAAAASRCGDAALHGRALAALGGALVHALRGRDGEGAVVLQEALLVAERAGDRVTAVTVLRELGFVEVQAGHRKTADHWLVKAHALAGTDAELAAILGVRGMNASDLADYPAAFDHLHESVDRAARCEDGRQQAWSLSILARAHLLRGEHSQAGTALAGSLDLVRRHRWTAFLPWPQALQAELDLAAGDEDAAADGFEQAWALGCQVNDPCWESMAARGLGLLHARRGDYGAASSWFGEASAAANRVPDRYQWLRAYVLDATITAALDRPARDRTGRDRTARLVATLASLAARAELRELVVRAQLHRHRLGDPAGLTSARLLGADIDNPVLAGLLSGDRPTGGPA